MDLSVGGLFDCRTPQICGCFVAKSLQILLGNCGKTEPATRNTKDYLWLCSQLPKQLTTVLKKEKIKRGSNDWGTKLRKNPADCSKSRKTSL